QRRRDKAGEARRAAQGAVVPVAENRDDSQISVLDPTSPLHDLKLVAPAGLKDVGDVAVALLVDREAIVGAKLACRADIVAAANGMAEMIAGSALEQRRFVPGCVQGRRARQRGDRNLRMVVVAELHRTEAVVLARYLDRDVVLVPDLD